MIHSLFIIIICIVYTYQSHSFQLNKRIYSNFQKVKSFNGNFIPKVDSLNKFSISNSQKAVLSIGILGLIKYQYINGPSYLPSTLLPFSHNTVITGGNTGLGKENAIALTAFGSNVYILCRNQEKGQIACQNILNDAKQLQNDLKLTNTIGKLQVYS